MAVQIINGIMAVFFVIGALDYLLDNKLGLGSEFERGFGCAEKLFITMGGFVALAPVIARVLSPVVCPFFRRLGADPSLFAGIFSGVDAGGYPLALQLADDPAMGVFNGAIVGSMLGVALLCTIPLGIASTKPQERVSMIYGLICGLITIPIGCLVGGLVGGYGMTGVLKNTLPVLVLSIVLSLLLLFAKDLIVRILIVFGKIILAIAVFGMVVSGLQFLLDRTLIEGLTGLGEVCTIIGQICIFIAGAFPMLAVLRRLLRKPLAAVSRKLGINEVSSGDFLTTLASSLPTLADLPLMDEKGRMLNVAFATSACFVFGDHLAYLAAAAPEVSVPMIAAKLTAGICGLALAVLLAPRLLKK